MLQFLCLVLGLAFSPGPPASANPVVTSAATPGQKSLSKCLDRAGARIAEWRKEGMTQADIDKRYRAAVAACASPQASSALTGCAAAVSFDQARLARLLAAKKLSPAEYLAAVRDRSRKLARCRRDPNWARALAHGDDDGDLVPNAFDRCPGTPDLAPTDDRGCPTKQKLPDAPSPDDVNRALQAFGFVGSPICDSAPVPEVPTPILLGVILGTPAPVKESLEVTVSKVINQPAGCHVLYEITIRATSPINPSSPEVGYFQFVFRDAENIETEPLAQTRQRFFIQFPGPSPLAYRNLQWRVRAMNGSGIVSGWSELRLAHPAFA